MKLAFLGTTLFMNIVIYVLAVFPTEEALR